MPFEDFGRHANGFAERRVRMDGLADIGRLAAHLDGQADLADQVSGMGADDAAADDPVRGLVKDQLGEALVAAIGDGPARGRPGKDRFTELDALGFALLLGLAGLGDLRVGIGDRGNLPGVEEGGLACSDPGKASRNPLVPNGRASARGRSEAMRPPGISG